MLSRVLKGPVHLVLLKCVHDELTALVQDLSPQTLTFAKSLKKESCRHEGHKSPQECIKKYLGNKNNRKLFIATQDRELREHFRLITGVPLLYFKHSLITLDPPTNATIEKAARVLFT